MINILSILLTATTAIADSHKSKYYYDEPMHQEKYTNNNQWIINPTIVICKDMTIFDRKQVRFASSLWTSIDFKISNIVIAEKCDYEHEYGKIKIVDGKHISSSLWGYTKYIYRVHKTFNGKEYKVYKSAVIQLDKNVTDLDLLIHELGHAFGFDHYEGEKDVMNSILDLHDGYLNKFPY
jgi:hypothetical protein